MNLPAPWSSGVSPEVARFQRLARRSIREARSWAEKLAQHGVGNEAGTRERLFRETLTLAAFLLTRHSRESDLTMCSTTRRRLTAVLRDEFANALAQIHRRAASDMKTPGATLDRQLACYADGDREGLEITARMFDRFREVTGMHSPALTGAGPNLAPIFFYLRIFALIDADERLTLEQRRCLLRTAQQCHEHLAATSDTTFPAGDRPPALPKGANRPIPPAPIQRVRTLAHQF